MRAALLLIVTLAVSAVGFAQETKSRMVKFDGVKINYFDVGNSKAENALVLVHCWTCNAEFWRGSMKAFPNHRVIAMDLPGHGTSDKPKRDYSIEYFAQAVNKVMRDAGVRRAVLAGHSMGTPIIRKYYELYPEKTAGLIIVDGALLPYGSREELEKFFAPIYADYAANSAKFLDGMLPATMDDKLRVFIKSSMLATPDYVAVSAMRLMNEDAYAKHGTISVPVLSVMAPSPFWPKDIEAKYRSVAPNHEFLMWPGTTHFLQMERPKEFNEVVAAFIAKNKLL